MISGIICVAAAHLSANLINDAADAKTGVDDYDQTYYGFFGGSKLIQEGKLSISWYYRAAILAAIISTTCVLVITLKTDRWEIPFFYAAVIFFAWQYSCKPLAFAYHGLGELTIFILFGPVCIAGGSYFAGAGYPGSDLLVISLAFGCLTSGILVANEVPDAEADLKGGKRNLVVRIGAHKGWLLFLLFELTAWLIIIFCWHVSYISALAAIPCFIGLPLSLYAAFILKKHPTCSEKLILSSRLAIATQIIVGLSLVLQEIF